MRISLLGYGKMGKAIEAEAVARGHQIVHRISRSEPSDWQRMKASTTDAVIEFTHPQAFDGNLERVLKKGIPLVSGTTGWYDRMAEIEEKVSAHSGKFLFGANFSIGVNILFQLNKKLAEMLNAYPEYDVFIEERHHRNKADGPSGTAHVLAQQILERLDRKQHLANPADLLERAPKNDELSVGFIRTGDIKGTHSISYVSDIDGITIQHEAQNRRGFALGAVIAAERLVELDKGCYNFETLFENP